MKIIDLLDKIANGEALPKKIYCFNGEFYLKGNTYFGDTFTLMHYIQEEDLNDEVEILDDEDEEKGLPEKLFFTHISDYNDQSVVNNNFNNYFKKTQETINQLIDYLEKQSKGE